MLINKCSECNTRFDDTYRLQVQCMHRLSSHDKIKRDMKKRKSSNKINDCITGFDDTYILYQYNIGIDDHHHIKKR